MATSQLAENQQRSYEVFGKKHYMACTTNSVRQPGVFCALSGAAAACAAPWAGGRVCGILPLDAMAGGRAPPYPTALLHDTRSRTMTERCTLDGFVITPIEPQGSLYAGTDHGRLFINEAQTGVMARWSMGHWTDRAAREAIIAHAMTMTLADFRRWFARHAASCLVD